jgi:hypothetical protein
MKQNQIVINYFFERNFFIDLTTNSRSPHCSHLVITFHPEYHRQVAHVRQVSASNLVQVTRSAEGFRFLINFLSPFRQVGVGVGARVGVGWSERHFII